MSGLTMFYKWTDAIRLDESNFYGGLVDYKAKEYYRAKHSKNKFVNGKNRVNDIKNF